MIIQLLLPSLLCVIIAVIVVLLHDCYHHNHNCNIILVAIKKKSVIFINCNNHSRANKQHPGLLPSKVSERFIHNIKSHRHVRTYLPFERMQERSLSSARHSTETAASETPLGERVYAEQNREKDRGRNS